MRSGGILPDSTLESADALRQTTPTTALSAYGQQCSHRAAVLRAIGRQNADRNFDPRYVAQWEQFQLALHELDVTQHVATTRLDLIKSTSMRTTESLLRWRNSEPGDSGRYRTPLYVRITSCVNLRVQQYS